MSINFDSDPTADRLVSLGYEPAETDREFSSDGSTRREWTVQTMRPLRIPNGNAAEFTPPQNCVVLTYTYASEHWPEEFSKVAARVADALVSLFATPDGPLVRRTKRSVEFIYRLEGVVCPRLDDPSVNHSRELYAHGLEARDQNAVLVLCVGCPHIPVGNVTEWLNGRSPLTVARKSLPEFDAEATSVAVVGLVGRFAADLEPCGRYLEPAPVSAGPAARENLTDPKDRDPFDPIRFIPGAIQKLFARRRELGVDGLDDDQLHAKLAAQREAARGPGRYMPWLD